MASEGARVVRTAFFSRLRSAFYSHLKANYGIFKDWGFVDLWALIDSIVNSKAVEINSFLDSSNFTLRETDQAIKYIINEFLVPEIDKIRL